MGSFTEVLLNFDFRQDVPDHVLAAFSSLVVDGDWDADTPPRPLLPEPVIEIDESWEPYREIEDGEPDAHADEPWVHNWAAWVSVGMGVQTVPYATLRWNFTSRWRLDCRFSWKGPAVPVPWAIEWLAPFIETWDGPADPQLIGTAHYEYDTRPCLLWLLNGQLVLENPNDDDQYGPEKVGRLVLVSGPQDADTTSYLTQLQAEQPTWRFAVDFLNGKVDGGIGPMFSPSFGAVVAHLLEGRTAVVHDHDFHAFPDNLEATRNALTRWAPLAQVEIHTLPLDSADVL